MGLCTYTPFVLNLTKTWYVLHLNFNRQKYLFTVTFQFISNVQRPVRDQDRLWDLAVNVDISNRGDATSFGE